MLNIFFSQVTVSSFLWFSQLSSHTLSISPPLHRLLSSILSTPISECCQHKHKLSSFFFYWLLLLPCLFTPVSSCPKTPAPLRLWSISDLLWRPRGSDSPFIFPVQPLPPLPPTTTAHPPGLCVPPSWASQLSHIPAFTNLHLFENVPVSQSLSRVTWPP